MSSTDPDVRDVITWRKSYRSMANGSCVEVAADVNGIIIRDSANSHGTTLLLSRREWGAFVNAIKEGIRIPQT